MYLKIITNIIAISALAVVQIGFISGLPGWLSYSNLAVVVLVFVLGFWGFKYALIWTLGTAFLIDIYSFEQFGLHSLSLLTAMLSANFLLNGFFTNRSLYSFAAVGALTGFIYKILLFFGTYIIDLLSGETAVYFWSYGFWQGRLIEVLMSVMIAAGCFYLLAFLGTSLKPAQLDRKRL
jgi:hypothetical protein